MTDRFQLGLPLSHFCDDPCSQLNVYQASELLQCQLFFLSDAKQYKVQQQVI